MSVPDVCGRRARLEPFSSRGPTLAKLEVTALTHERVRAPAIRGSPPGAVGGSRSGWDLGIHLLLPSTVEELLPACACQVVAWLLPAPSRQHYATPVCSGASGIPERTEITPARPSGLHG